MSSTDHELKKICHFLPSKYTCMAYDKESNLIAVGCETGEVAILREKSQEIRNLSVSSSRSVEFLSFVVGKSLLLIVLKNDPTLYLWNVNTKSLVHTVRTKEICDELFENSEDPNPVSHVTCVIWSQHGFFYIGTDVGTVKTLMVQGPATETDDTKHELVWGSESFSFKKFKDPFNGNVIAIQEKISDKSKGSEVLLLSSNGHCVLWTWSPGESSTCQKGVKTKDSLISVWWSTNGSKTTAKHDGTITVHKMIGNTEFSCQEGESSAKIYKIKPFKIGTAGDDWLIYATEETAHILSLCFHRPGFDNTKVTKRILPFGAKIIDFELIDQGKSAVFAVLTEHELVVLGTKNDPEGGNVGVRLSHRYPCLTSPVTSLQHCGNCTEHFMKGVVKGHLLFDCQEMATDHKEFELIATGHSDGSVRLWLCSKGLDTFGCVLVMYTADNFSQLDDDMKEIILIKVTNSQKFMSVVNQRGRVLLFRLSKQQESQQSEKPQSQEIILKETDDKSKEQSSRHSEVSPVASLPSLSSLASVSVTASLPVIGPSAITSSTQSKSQALETPAPHFRPCEWQERHVQLMQHFSCHYEKQSGGKLEPVTVNCVDYNEQMGIWLIGTEKGLVILIPTQNILLDVIGSDKKLFEKSGLKTKKISSINACSCHVVCVETISEIRWTDSQALPQTSLWVGTADRALGVFTIDDSAEHEIVLQKTGEGKVKSNDIVDILRCQSTRSEDLYVVTVTKKQIKSYVYPGGKSLKSAKDSIKSGIVSNKEHVPYLITLTSSGILHLLTLPGLKSTPYDDGMVQKGIKRNSVGKVLFSSGGQHVVLCTENEVFCRYPFIISKPRS